MTCPYDKPYKGKCGLCCDLADCTATEKRAFLAEGQEALQFNHTAMEKARRDRLITIPDLARNIGATIYQVKRYESGATIPYAGTVIKLAKALRIPLDRLYKEDT